MSTPPPPPPAYPDAKDPIPESPSHPMTSSSFAASEVRVGENVQTQSPIQRPKKSDECEGEGQEEEELAEGKEPEPPAGVDSSVLLASSLRLQLIRTRSAFSPLRFSPSVCAPSILSEDAVLSDNEINARPTPKTPHHQNVVSKKQGNLTYSLIVMHLHTPLFN